MPSLLGNASNFAIEHAPKYELQQAETTADLFGTELTSYDLELSLHRVGTYLRELVDALYGGKGAPLAKAFGVNKSVLHGWTHENHVPQLFQLMNVALFCHAPLNNSPIPSIGPPSHSYLIWATVYKGEEQVARTAPAGSREKLA